MVTLTIPPRTADLARCIESVAAQTRAPEEHLILCDHRAEGQVALRNRALGMIQTEYTAFLDDDDWLLPRHVEALLEHAEATGADLVYPGYEMNPDLYEDPRYDPLGMFGRPFDSESLARANYIPITHLCRTESMREVGGFPGPDEWRQAGCTDEGDADWGLLNRLYRAGAKIVHLPERTWVWSLRPGTTRGISWVLSA